jgi:hypothetical protein
MAEWLRESQVNQDQHALVGMVAQVATSEATPRGQLVAVVAHFVGSVGHSAHVSGSSRGGAIPKMQGFPRRNVCRPHLVSDLGVPGSAVRGEGGHKRRSWDLAKQLARRESRENPCELLV